MTKRRYLFIYVIVLCVVLCACSAGQAEEQTDTPPPAEGAAESLWIAETTDAPEEEAMAEAAPEAPYFAQYDGSYAEPAADGELYLQFRASDITGESYLTITENNFVSTGEESMLTFSLKVDTASYNNVERYLNSGKHPPADAVRIEELVNYFSYDELLYAQGGNPFGIYAEVGPSPFNADNYLAFVRVRSSDIDKSVLPSSNLTFLIDSSGSMESYDKLPLLKEAFALLVETLDENDRVSIVTYAGSSEIVLDGASGAEKDRILDAINSLQASGSTAGANGIHTAYALAEENFLAGGNNRVILATDGDFNVGISSNTELENYIATKRGSGVYLSILGFGTGNIRDDMMETLSKHGNGNFSYINSVHTAKKVLVDELSANLFTVADDVKAQVEFNPNNVESYRLIGYENRAMDNRDFRDDTKDAGEIGVGADVVVLFEVTLKTAPVGSTFSDELFEVRIRYKDPGASDSKEMTYPVGVERILPTNTSDFTFASSVASFGHLLRGSDYTGTANIESVTEMARSSLGFDKGGYRRTHLDLLTLYQKLAG